MQKKLTQNIFTFRNVQLHQVPKTLLKEYIYGNLY